MNEELTFKHSKAPDKELDSEETRKALVFLTLVKGRSDGIKQDMLKQLKEK